MGGGKHDKIAWIPSTWLRKYSCLAGAGRKSLISGCWSGLMSALPKKRELPDRDSRTEVIRHEEMVRKKDTGEIWRVGIKHKRKPFIGTGMLDQNAGQADLGIWQWSLEMAWKPLTLSKSIRAKLWCLNDGQKKCAIFNQLWRVRCLWAICKG